MNKIKKEKKLRAYLNSNEEVTQEINSNGVLIEYLDDAPRYEINFHYLFGWLIFLTKKDLLTNRIQKISALKVLQHKIKYITEYNRNSRLKINDRDGILVRNLIEKINI